MQVSMNTQSSPRSLNIRVKPFLNICTRQNKTQIWTYGDIHDLLHWQDITAQSYMLSPWIVYYIWQLITVTASQFYKLSQIRLLYSNMAYNCQLFSFLSSHLKHSCSSEPINTVSVQHFLDNLTFHNFTVLQL